MAQIIEGAEAKNLGREEKWKLLSPYLRKHGREALAYATLQQGMEYFIEEGVGYIAYNTITHRIFAPKPKRITLCDPICAIADYPRLLRSFLQDNPRAAFIVISESCAAALHDLGFKANCLGYESELPIQQYNTRGDWKELSAIKRARNEAKREQLTIQEVDIEKIDHAGLNELTKKWIGTKKVNDHEISVYARKANFINEPDVRKFVAYDKTQQPVGFAFYDPMYDNNEVYGYCPNTVRSDEKTYGHLVAAIHMEAMEKFKTEGKKILNLGLAPFSKLYQGKFNDDKMCQKFLTLCEKYGGDIYNFRGLSFYKSKYRGMEKNIYLASNSLMPTNDIYLAFLGSGVTQSYASTLFPLLKGIFRAMIPKQQRDGETT